MPGDRSSDARAWFERWVEGFADLEGLHELLALKREHTLRVAGLTRRVAEGMGWPQDVVEKAEVAGVLHDVGRFPQYRAHATFSDARSEDHGELGYRVLISSYPWEGWKDEDREDVLLAVRHHNDRSIPDSVVGSALPVLRALRDGDKLDVYFVVREWVEDGRVRKLFPRMDLEGPLSPEIVAAMSERRSAPYDKVRSLLDYHMVQMSWMYDLNYPPSFRILVDTGLFEWTAGRLPADEVRDVLDEVRERVSEMLRSS